MKDIILIPKTWQGVVSLNNPNLIKMVNINDSTQINMNLRSQGKNPKNYKFCQSECGTNFPEVFTVEDKIGSSEFELKRVTYKELPLKDKQKESLIKNKYMMPIAQDGQLIVAKMLDLLFDKATDLFTDDETEFKKLLGQKEKVKEQLNGFDYKQYLNEIV